MRILIAEDEAHNREALGDLLRRLGHEVTAANDGEEALGKATRMTFDVILSDVRMPGMDGLQFFDSLLRLRPTGAPVPAFAFMTAYGRVDDAVEAMRKGALHFLAKPLRKKDLMALLDEVERLAPRAESPGQDARASFRHEAVYVSRAFEEAVNMVDRVAGSLASVLLVGESGTGKEVLARRLHAKSNRAAGPFVAFHAGAMPESLLESELFGHEKGAYTGADSARQGQIRAAHGGTFFLDELSSMPMALQTKLLRVIQDRMVQPLGSNASTECDVRWVAATNVELGALAARGSFREDLLYRLSVVVIDLPPLRARPEDVDALADRFVLELAEREGRAPLSIPETTRALLRAYSWPGNVRELRNVIERAIALAQGPELVPALLPEHVAVAARAAEIRIAVGTSLQSAEDQLIEQTLRSCGGDKTQAAAILGVAPRTIYRWLERRDQ